MTPDYGPFGLGPWSLEPDEKAWVDRGTGLRCYARRHPKLGHLCGYVGIPTTPNIDADTLDVHGGITYEADHIPGKAQEIGMTWYGFDCGHAGDLSPGTRSYEHDDNDVYRTLDYVEQQCRELARQLKELVK